MLTTELIPAPQRDSKRLMVVLHGLGDSMDGYRWLPSALHLSGLNYLLVNAPDPYYGGLAWFDFSGDRDIGIRRSRSLLFELLDDLWTRGFSPPETMVFGFSQGSVMTIEVGARYRHLLAGLVGVSGFVHQPETLLRELSPVARSQRFLLTHGTQDPMVPFDPARRQVQELKRGGLNIEWREFDKAHTIAGEEELTVIRNFTEECLSPRNS